MFETLAAYIVTLGISATNPPPLAELEEKIPALACMAKNIYFEAGSESFVGKVAVANVTINRVESNSFPAYICDVVHQGPVYESWKTVVQKDLPDEERIYYPKKHKCQFSWYCDGVEDRVVENSNTWKESLRAAILTIKSYDFDITEDATHYHADYVNPYWAPHLHKIVTIGRHIFYR